MNILNLHEVYGEISERVVNDGKIERSTRQKTHNLFWPDENSIEQCFAANIVQGCQQHCSTLLHLIAG